MFNDDYHDSTLHQSRFEDAQKQKMEKMANALKACRDDYEYRAKWAMENSVRKFLMERASSVTQVLEDCGYF